MRRLAWEDEDGIIGEPAEEGVQVAPISGGELLTGDPLGNQGPDHLCLFSLPRISHRGLRGFGYSRLRRERNMQSPSLAEC
jgi:hypothetical protein